jgi:uncharacterized protein DUF4397
VHSRRITAAILALATATTLVACSNDDNDNPVGTGNKNTTVRFFNALSGGTNIDVAQNGTVGAGNSAVAFGAASSCTKVNNANPQLTIRPNGSSTNLSGFSPAFESGKTYTVLVTGTQAAPVYSLLTDDFQAPSTGNAGVRIVNATTSATTGTGLWDIYVNPGTTLGTPVVTALGRTMATTYLTVPAGQANTIRLTNSGSTSTLQNLTIPSLTSGTVTTIVVTDAATTGGTQLQTFTLPACTTT